MPEQQGSRYEKLPRPESIRFFVQSVSEKPTVSGVEQIGPQTFLLAWHGSPLVVFLSNIYTLGEAAAQEIVDRNPSINAIVLAITYCGYTREAKQFCGDRGIALHGLREFMGVLYRSRSELLDYHPRQRD
jgi:hypothetical protein